jgi:hypothetical protein
MNLILFKPTCIVGDIQYFCRESQTDITSGYYTYVGAKREPTDVEEIKHCTKGLVRSGGKVMLRHPLSSTRSGTITVILITIITNTITNNNNTYSTNTNTITNTTEEEESSLSMYACVNVNVNVHLYSAFLHIVCSKALKRMSLKQVSMFIELINIEQRIISK